MKLDATNFTYQGHRLWIQDDEDGSARAAMDYRIGEIGQRVLLVQDKNLPVEERIVHGKEERDTPSA